MSDNCPICDTPLREKRGNSDGMGTFFSCMQCGSFVLSHVLVDDLPYLLETIKDARAKISHTIRIRQQKNKPVNLITKDVNAILELPLPSPLEQSDLLVRWIAENIEGPGEPVWVKPQAHSAIIGAKSPSGFAHILEHLFKEGLVIGDLKEPGVAHATLSIKGSDYYEKLRRGEITHRKAFMAMEFNNKILDKVYEHIFKPCVMQTGFELIRLDDAPLAGLIDNRLREEIKASDFIIADLSNDNSGAYWEAGYAEGLGKVVIYTCEKGEFESKKTHFDTNHHQTIAWDEKLPHEAGKSLKAVIRATFPELAKKED